MVEGFKGGEAAVPIKIGADAEGFQIPTVFAVVLRGEFGPEFVCYGAILKS